MIFIVWISKMNVKFEWNHRTEMFVYLKYVIIDFYAPNYMMKYRLFTLLRLWFEGWPVTVEAVPLFLRSLEELWWAISAILKYNVNYTGAPKMRYDFYASKFSINVIAKLLLFKV